MRRRRFIREPRDLQLFIAGFQQQHPLGLRYLARWLLASHWSRDDYRQPEDYVDALEALGIQGIPRDDDDDDDDGQKPERINIGSQLRARLAELEQQPDFLEPLAGNLAQTVEAAGLEPLVATVYRSLVAVALCPPLAGLLQSQQMDFSQSLRILAWFMGCPAAELFALFRELNPLETAGLLRCDANDTDWNDHFKLPDDLLAFIVMEGFSLRQLLDMLVRPLPPPVMQREDFAQLGDDLALLEEALRNALDSGRAGVNILLYGPPGTGKTQLAQYLVQAVGAEGLEIRARALGRQRDSDDRFSIFRRVQSLAPRDRRQVVLFDEVEDVFGFGNNSDTNKASINFNLETNRLPAIWISNNVRCMDDAYIRRFDIVLPVLSPNISTRERILKEAMAPLSVPKKLLRQAAEHPHVTPGILTRAAAVVKSCGQDNGVVAGKRQQRAARERLLRLVNNTLVCQGYDSLLPPVVDEAAAGGYRMETPYDLACVNASMPLAELAEVLSVAGEGRVCLSGPPGTGKSAFVHELGRMMKRKVLLGSPSTVQDKYVGETEKNMARLFEQAGREKAILFLDEFDSFLSSRDRHQRSWETSQTNEMLTQIERFGGILFAATNQRDMIDKAAVRRFDFKVEFDWMKPEQALLLFSKLLRERGWQQELQADYWQQQLAALRCLAPGDFAVAARQARLMGDRQSLDPQRLLGVLQQEVQAKHEQGGRAIGFLANV